MSEALEDQGHGPRPATESASKKQHNGTRWPLNAKLPESWIELGHEARRKSGLPRINLAPVAEDFVDYWTAKAGRDACKLDWLATWRRWCRNTRGTPEPEPHPPQKQPTHPLDVDHRTVEMWRKGIRTANCGPQMLERAVEKGLLTPEQAKRLGA